MKNKKTLSQKIHRLRQHEPLVFWTLIFIVAAATIGFGVAL